MTTAAIAMFKDEADIAADVLHHLADEGFDLIVVADNNSTDGTGEILQGLRLKGSRRNLELIVVDDPDVAYYQSAKMTHLANVAHVRGADWIVPFDADELWFHPDERIGLWLETLHPDVGVVRASLTNHFCSGLDPDKPAPFDRIEWRQRKPAALPKVAFRWSTTAVIEQGNHGVTGVPGDIIDGLQVRHFPYRSVEQFIHKAVNGAAAYAATDLPENQGAHWRGYGALLDRYGEKALEEVYGTFYHFLSPVDVGMVWDPAPFMRWQRPPR